MAEGIIFSVEEFALNDGPGIRTTVFLKGCPLRCSWCHNPEGLSPLPQVMHRNDRDEICGERISAEELAGRLLKQKDFLIMNGGGVTFTGGEPTSQPEFLIEVLDRLEGLNRAMETSGYCREDVFRNILTHLDYVLFDLKLIDPVGHKRWTGVDNSIILANLAILQESGLPHVIRIPLIPGVNDTLENMRATASLLEGDNTLVRVELLRYHKTAGAKYSMVDMEYAPGFDTEASVRIFNCFSNKGIKLMIL